MVQKTNTDLLPSEEERQRNEQTDTRLEMGKNKNW